MIQLYHYDWASVPLGLTRNNLFWAFPVRFWFGVILFGFLTQLPSWDIYSNYVMTQAVFRKFESIRLTTQGTFQVIDSESTHASSRSPGIDSDRLKIQADFQGIDSESTHDSSGSPGVDSNRLMTQAKKLILSRLMIQLWVIPTSAGNYSDKQELWWIVGCSL